MRYIVFTAFLLGAIPAVADEVSRADRRAQCVDWMMTAYPSGLEEVACNAQFALPSPFLFKCARAQKVGFRDSTERDACQIFLANTARKIGNGYIRNGAEK